MSSLAEIVNSLSDYDRIIVTGPQRAGTTIAAKILACELDYRFVAEEEVGGASLERLFEQTFRPRQISHTGADEAIAALERDLQLNPDQAKDHNREKFNGKIRRKSGRDRGKSSTF